jgi:hypothetical protein
VLKDIMPRCVGFQLIANTLVVTRSLPVLARPNLEGYCRNDCAGLPAQRTYYTNKSGGNRS